MMGHREPLKSAAEVDATSRAARRHLAYLQIPGATASIKRQITRRGRRDARRSITEERYGLV
jgi:hypothetical protein